MEYETEGLQACTCFLNITSNATAFMDFPMARGTSQAVTKGGAFPGRREWAVGGENGIIAVIAGDNQKAKGELVRWGCPEEGLMVMVQSCLDAGP